MRLSRPFYRLPVRFDVARMRREVSDLPAQSWISHPNDIGGNSALRLITVGGGENDDVDGVMRPTANLLGAPYLRQVLASMGVVWSRSRLMKLAPHADVPEHADINYHWYYRVRIHIPVFTHPSVMFRCGDEAVHMAAGEAWIFDNWRRHSVVNPSAEERIHLVADTGGNSTFWQFVAQGHGGTEPHEHRFDAAQDVQPKTEQTTLALVMPPAEVDLLLMDLRAELTANDNPAASRQLAQYAALLDAFRRDWRQLYALHGERALGWPHYANLRQELRDASKAFADGLFMRTNRIDAHKVLEGRLLRAILPAVADAPAIRARSIPIREEPLTLRRPVFIIAAPRSGSTLLFETLASSDNLVNLGGEAHWLVEDIEALRPWAADVKSNRLDATHVTRQRAEWIVNSIVGRLRDADGVPVPPHTDLRLLEKTPKNVLRVPFFDRLFPDALFVFLWRDPRENLSSIIEAWRSGGWKTYNGLDGFDGPWSLLLPPGWREMNGRPLEEIASFQWSVANTIALDDLARLAPERWVSVCHAKFVADPEAQITRICQFIGIEMDARLQRRLSQPLPPSRFTQTAPEPNKWRRNASLIEPLLPALEGVWRRLQELG